MHEYCLPDIHHTFSAFKRARAGATAARLACNFEFLERVQYMVLSWCPYAYTDALEYFDCVMAV
jgi:hypothetical protein